MKYVKMISLLAVAATALTAFAATASATTLTSPTGTAYVANEKKLTAVNTENVSLDGAFTTVVCTSSHVEGEVETNGAGVTAGGKISNLTFGGCNFTVVVEAFGSLEVHPVKTNVDKVEGCPEGTYCAGTLTSTGAKVKIITSVGTCVFTTNATDVGLVTGTNETGGEAVLDIGLHGTGKIPRTEGNFLCGSSGQWTGKYKVSTPNQLWLDK